MARAINPAHIPVAIDRRDPQRQIMNVFNNRTKAGLRA